MVVDQLGQQVGSCSASSTRTQSSLVLSNLWTGNLRNVRIVYMQIGMHGAVPISTSQEPSEPVAVYNLTEHHILPLSLAEQKNIDWDRIS